MISAGVFFISSKCWFFGFLGEGEGRGVKGQKVIQNDKKICLSCSIAQEPYIIWLSFMVHMCKMIIFPDSFLFDSRQFFVILDCFLPFYPAMNPENQNFKKINKNTERYLQMCTLNYSHIMYVS